MNSKGGDMTARKSWACAIDACITSLWIKKIRASRSKEFQKHDSPSGLVKYPQVGVAVAADWRTTARILRARAPAAPRAATARFSLRCGSVVVVATALTPWRLLESVAILHAVFVSSSISCIMQQSNTKHFPSLPFTFYSILFDCHVPSIHFLFSFRTDFSHFFIKIDSKTVTIYRCPDWLVNYSAMNISSTMHLIIEYYTLPVRCHVTHVEYG